MVLQTKLPLAKFLSVKNCYLKGFYIGLYNNSWAKKLWKSPKEFLRRRF